MLPIVLDEQIVDGLFNAVADNNGYTLTVDLPEQVIRTSDGEEIAFEVDAFRKHCLINGLDDIGLTLEDADSIRQYEEKRRQQAPWLFNN